MWGNVTALYSAAHRSADEVLLIDPAPPLSTGALSALVYTNATPHVHQEDGVADPSFSRRLIPKKSSEHQIHTGWNSITRRD